MKYIELPKGCAGLLGRSPCGERGLKFCGILGG